MIIKTSLAAKKNPDKHSIQIAFDFLFNSSDNLNNSLKKSWINRYRSFKKYELMEPLSCQELTGLPGF